MDQWWSVDKNPRTQEPERIMREIDCTVNTLICAGECVSSVWPLKTRDSVKFLEKKEVFCSWFQANGLGVETQFPALRVNEKFFSMPLRVQEQIRPTYHPFSSTVRPNPLVNHVFLFMICVLTLYTFAHRNLYFDTCGYPARLSTWRRRLRGYQNFASRTHCSGRSSGRRADSWYARALSG